MNVVLVGVSHHTAQVEVREHFTVASADWVKTSMRLSQLPGVEEAALLCTCNRTELVAVASDPVEGLVQLRSFLSNDIAGGACAHEPFYEREGSDAVEHVFRVASSLDSMVVGEAQILGQVKAAYNASVEASACGPILNRLFQRAFRTAKRVRSETSLGSASVSVARVGVQLAGELFESLGEKSVALLGAGEMATSALIGLRDAGVHDVVVVNRTLEAAERLARRLEGRAALLSGLAHELERVDVVVASVQVDRPLLRVEDLRGPMGRRHGRPLLLIDLGLPRNVDPRVNDLDGVYLYDLDDLDGIATRGRSQRRSAVTPAEAIVTQERDRFGAWQAGLSAVPDIRALLSMGERVAEDELQRALTGLGDTPPEVHAALSRALEAATARLLHAPLALLRAEAEERRGPYYAEAIRAIFGLSEEDE